MRHIAGRRDERGMVVAGPEEVRGVRTTVGAAIGRWTTARFRRFVAGRGRPAERAAPGDRPIATVPAPAMAAIGAQSRTVRPSPWTADRQRAHHPDLTPADCARVQRILDEGEVFSADPRHAMAFLDMDGRPRRAVLDAARDGSEPRLASLHKVKPRERPKRINRDGK